MPPKRRPANSNETVPFESSLYLDRIAKLLALVATKGLTQAEQTLLLDGVGFSTAEIAKLLRTTPNTVSVTIYQSKKAKKGKKAPKKE